MTGNVAARDAINTKSNCINGLFKANSKTQSRWTAWVGNRGPHLCSKVELGPYIWGWDVVYPVPPKAQARVFKWSTYQWLCCKSPPSRTNCQNWNSSLDTCVQNAEPFPCSTLMPILPGPLACCFLLRKQLKSYSFSTTLLLIKRSNKEDHNWLFRCVLRLGFASTQATRFSDPA